MKQPIPELSLGYAAVTMARVEAGELVRYRNTDPRDEQGLMHQLIEVAWIAGHSKAQRAAERECGCSIHTIRRELAAHGYAIGCQRWQTLVDRIVRDLEAELASEWSVEWWYAI